jgi:hypothetical protein
MNNQFVVSVICWLNAPLYAFQYFQKPVKDPVNELVTAERPIVRFFHSGTNKAPN